MKHHVATIHHGEGRHNCEHCDQSFALKQNLKRHIVIAHPPTILPSKYKNNSNQDNDDSIETGVNLSQDNSITVREEEEQSDSNYSNEEEYQSDTNDDFG